jgi:hypothetical protein
LGCFFLVGEETLAACGTFCSVACLLIARVREHNGDQRPKVRTYFRLARWPFQGEFHRRYGSKARPRKIAAPWSADFVPSQKIANLIDPNMRDAEMHWLVFKRARRANSVNHWQVAAVVWHRVKAGDRRKAAYQHAVETLGVSFNTAEKAFAHWEKYFHVNAPPELGD